MGVLVLTVLKSVRWDEWVWTQGIFECTACFFVHVHIHFYSTFAHIFFHNDKF
jgi:hypothetical protein